MRLQAHGMTMTGVRRFLLIAVAVTIAMGCAGYILPSRTITVDIRLAAAGKTEIATGIDRILRKNGFERQARGGYDELTNQDTSWDYARNQEFLISVAMDYSDRLLIRISARSEKWDQRATDLFDMIALDLTREWPSATKVERPPGSIPRT